MANGDLKVVEEVKKGDLLLSPAGHPVEVKDVVVIKGEIITISQSTGNIKVSNSPETSAILELKLGKRKQIFMRIKISFTATFESRSDNIIFRYNDLLDHITEDGRTIQLARYCSKYFTKSSAREEITDFINKYSKKEGKSFFEWCCEAQDLSS